MNISRERKGTSRNISVDRRVQVGISPRLGRLQIEISLSI